ncbi:MAG: prolyl oligopeptidase family serine peptidase [Verrucomicrobia bacterium]|nr:prolyl oligopeptidase family serine peptidase [Verrucomicrobiota bacterium]
MSRLALLLTLTVVAACSAAEPIEVLATKSGLRFGIWPKRPEKPAPTMFVLSGKLEDTLGSTYFRQAGEFLAKDGWLLVSVDLPSHGQEMRPKGDSGLGGWRARINNGEDPVADVTGRLSRVLDHLLTEKLADSERIAALGTSRGGFVAFHFAAADKRVKCAAGFAPVTDLAALSEFRFAETNALVQRLALERHADALAGRALWLVIGDRDARVSTDAAIRFARHVTAVSLEKKLPALVELHVVSEPKGHTVPAGYAEKAAEWFRKQFPEKR